MPNQPRTPARSVRVDDALWLAARRKAADNGEQITDVIRRLLAEYAADYLAEYGG